MADIAHADMTGDELHEPKGVENASLGEVYVANGNGSGSWNNIGTSSFTGMIADFAWPVVQEGWLECDGSDINTTTYSALYNAMTIQMTGTRTSGNATITSLSSTTNMRVGYYVYGTGIPAGTTVSTINSSTQITLSTNATSSGTSIVVVSPWYLDNGTIRLPDLSSAGRFRRSRSSATQVGELQDSANISHTHGVSGTTGNESATHSHNLNINSNYESANHTHGFLHAEFVAYSHDNGGTIHQTYVGDSTVQTGAESTPHYHNVSGSTNSASNNHTHNFSVTSASSGDTETRPTSIVMMTCVKT